MHIHERIGRAYQVQVTATFVRAPRATFDHGAGRTAQAPSTRQPLWKDGADVFGDNFFVGSMETGVLTP